MFPRLNRYSQLRLIALLSFFTIGCTQDYTPARPYAETASTLSIEEEDMLIDNGEILLEQLDLAEVTDVSAASKSLNELQEEKRVSEEAKAFVADDLPTAPWTDLQKLPLERWEVYYLRTQPLGYIQQSFRRSTAGDEDRIVIETKSSIQQSKNGESVQTQSDFFVVESATGELKSIDGKITQGDTVEQINVVVASDVVRVTKTFGERRTVENLARDKNIRGPFAVEESLISKPMIEGETRKLLVFEPSLADLVRVELVARGKSRVPVTSGEFLQLLEIEQRVHHKESILSTTLWIDEEGHIRKRYLGLRGLTAHSVPQDIAMAIRDATKLQGLAKKSISLDKPIDLPIEASSVVFRANSIEVDPFKIFSTNNWQLVRSLSPLSSDIEVQPLRVREILSRQAPAQRVQEQFLEASQFIDHRDKTIIDLKDEWLSKNTDLPKPLQIAAGVRGLVQLREMSFNVYPASQVALRKETDSLGAAFLACAALRSAEIPAQVATGLKYNKNSTSPAMEFHSWVEVFSNGQWLPIDCSQEDLALPLTTLKIADSAVSDQNPLTVVVPVFDAIQAINLVVR